MEVWNLSEVGLVIVKSREGKPADLILMSKSEYEYIEPQLEGDYTGAKEIKFKDGSKAIIYERTKILVNDYR